jgi:predicted nucleic acid-binding protein
VRALHAWLRRHQRIALDTSIFIYSLDANPRYVTLAREVLAWVEQPGHTSVTSTVTMTELLAKPYATLEEHRVEEVKEFLLNYPNLEWISADLEIADLAGQFRAAYRLKTPDALQAATAVRGGATGMVTNDAIFERVPAFETLTLERLL